MADQLPTSAVQAQPFRQAQMADQLPTSAVQAQPDSEGQVEPHVSAIGYAGPLPPAAEIQRWEETKKDRLQDEE